MLLLKPPEDSLILPVDPPPVKIWQRIRPQDYVSTLLPLGAFILWLFSLHLFNMHQMNDLGLISVMPPSSIIALAILSISFCLTLQDRRLRWQLLLLHVVLLIFMLYGVTALVEDAPRFSTVYKHVGYTDYIMRNGSVNPNLDIYFGWPTFFILGALFTKVAGFHDPLSFVAWAPVFLNLLYFGPLSLILSSMTRNRRVIWFATWIFFLVNWIGQDYYSPQGMNIFLYLVIIAILLKWFKVRPKELAEPDRVASKELVAYKQEGLWKRGWRMIRGLFEVSDTLITPTTFWQRAGLLLIMFGVFAFDISSHPLTPFFVLAGVTLLVLFRRIGPFWLPFPMWIMTVWWILVMGNAFLSGHSGMVLGSFGLLDNAVALNVTNRVVGSPDHVLITKICLVMTALFWGLAFLGALRRLLHGYRDLTIILLAIAPFPLLVAQSYGGEMLFRIYLIALPFMAFFMATLFFEPVPRLPVRWLKTRAGRWFNAKAGRWLTTGLIVVNLLFLGLFLFARYGNERNDYVTMAEVNAIRTLYTMAPHGSILMRGWEGGPWLFQDFENYDYYSLDDDALTVNIETNNYQALDQYVKQHKPPAAYMVFMRTTQASFASTSGLPPDRLNRIEHELLDSGDCKLVFKNKDAEIIQFIY